MLTLLCVTLCATCVAAHLCVRTLRPASQGNLQAFDQRPNLLLTCLTVACCDIQSLGDSEYCRPRRPSRTTVCYQRVSFLLGDWCNHKSCHVGIAACRPSDLRAFDQSLTSSLPFLPFGQCGIQMSMLQSSAAIKSTSLLTMRFVTLCVICATARLCVRTLRPADQGNLQAITYFAIVRHS